MTAKYKIRDIPHWFVKCCSEASRFFALIILMLSLHSKPDVTMMRDPNAHRAAH